jgi:hypothetical protein
MAIWTSKDAVECFRSADSIRNMYKKRFMGLTLAVLGKSEKLKGVDPAKISKEDLQEAFDGLKDFEIYDKLGASDAAIRVAVVNSIAKEGPDKGKFNYANLDKQIKDRDINQKFIDEMAKDPAYDKTKEQLDKLCDLGEQEAKKEIANGGKIEFSDLDKRMLENSLGKESSTAAINSATKYMTWNKVEETGALDALKGSEKGSKFWNDDSKYQNWTDMAAKAKDSVYNGVMGAETNILTAPLKIFFFGMHELLNPNSFFHRNVLGKLIKDIKNVKSNREAQKEYKRLGLAIDGLDGEESQEEQSAEGSKKTVTKAVKEIQRELMKGYDFKKDLEFLGAEPGKEEQQQEEKKEQPTQKAESWIREADGDQQNQTAVDAAADAGEDEKEEEQQQEQPQPEEKKEDGPTIEEIQDTVSAVVLRYNCLIYILMRAFAGAYGHDEAFKVFSFHPFTISKNDEGTKQQQNSQQNKENWQKVQKYFSNPTELQRLGIKSMKDAKTITAQSKKTVVDDLQKEGVPVEIIDKVLGTKNGVAESLTLDKWVELLTEANQKVVNPYRLSLTKGIDHWVKNDPLMTRLLVKNKDMRVEMQRNSKFSTFFAYANLFEEVLNEYSQYINAIKNHAKYEQFKDMDIKLSGIKNLKPMECTTNLQKAITYLSNHTDGSFGSEVKREFIALSMFKRITNISAFLTIRNLDFKNIEAFIKMCLPKVEMLRKPSATTCTISDEVAKVVFGDKGIPFSFIDAREPEKEEEKDENQEQAEKQSEQQAQKQGQQPEQNSNQEQQNTQEQK